MKLLLVRDYHGTDCTLGVLTAGAVILQTMECPWILDPDGGLCGMPFKSCVPAGDYALVPHNSPDHPKTFALFAPSLDIFDVPQHVPPGVMARSECLIHQGNYASNVEGCIAVGLHRARYASGSMVTNSIDALEMLLAAVPWMPGHTLTISNAP